MPITPNRSDLQFVEPEVEAIRSTVPPSIQTTILKCPTKQDVESQIHNFSIVHFACHGVARSNPSESGILFSDWQCNLFSVADAARINLENARVSVSVRVSCSEQPEFGIARRIVTYDRSLSIGRVSDRHWDVMAG